CAERSTHHEERCKQHGHTLRAGVRMADQEVSGNSTDERVQQVQEEAVPADGGKRVDEPQHSADRQYPAQREDGKSCCGLSLADAYHTQNRQQDAKKQEPAPGLSDLVQAGGEHITDRSHFISPFLTASLGCCRFCSAKSNWLVNAKQPQELPWARQTASRSSGQH